MNTSYPCPGLRGLIATAIFGVLAASFSNSWVMGLVRSCAPPAKTAGTRSRSTSDDSMFWKALLCEG